MGRKAGFTDDQVFEWLAGHMAHAPGVTVQQVSKGTGVSVGSLYHRYGSMEGLLAEAWLWAHSLYLSELKETLVFDGVRGAVRSALQALHLAAANRAAANLLFIVPERFLVRDGISAELRTRVAKEKEALAAALQDYADRTDCDVETVELAVLQVPRAILQKYLPDEEVPQQADFYIRKSCRMIIFNPLQPEDTSDE